MRLLTRKKLFRAFPELDAYSDETCGRFVKAAIRPLGIKLLIAVAVVPELVIGLSGALWGISAIVDAVDLRGRGPVQMGKCVMLGTGVAAWMLLAGAGAFWVRDWVVRGRISRLFRHHGRCPRCSYSLVGLAVGEGNNVLCPECAHSTTVDPSLGELVLDEQGRARFQPSPERAQEVPPRFTPAQWRQIGRWALRLAGVAILIPLLVVGGYEAVLQVQAAAAAAARPTARDFDAVIDAMQTPGVSAAAPNAWEALPSVWNLVNESNTVVTDTRERSKPDINRAYLALGGFDAGKGWYRGAQLDPAVDEAIARAGLKALSEAKAWDAISEMVHRPRRAPSSGWDSDAMPFSQLQSQVGPRELGEIGIALTGRMNLARLNNDEAEFARALEDHLELASMMSTYPWYGCSYAERELYRAEIAVREVLTTGHADWARSIAPVMAHARPLAPTALCRKAEALCYQDAICWLFEEPSRVRMERWSPVAEEMFGEIEWPIRVGFFWENMAMVKQLTTRITADSALSAAQRRIAPAAPPPQGHLAAAAYFELRGFELQAMDFQSVLDQGVLTLACIEKYRMDHDEYPARLQDLVDAGCLKTLPIDTYSDHPLAYERGGPISKAHHVPFVLYSVGPDGTDDGLSGVKQLPASVRETGNREDYSIGLIPK